MLGTKRIVYSARDLEQLGLQIFLERIDSVVVQSVVIYIYILNGSGWLFTRFNIAKNMTIRWICGGMMHSHGKGPRQCVLNAYELKYRCGAIEFYGFQLQSVITRQHIYKFISQQRLPLQRWIHVYITYDLRYIAIQCKKKIIWKAQNNLILLLYICKWMRLSFHSRMGWVDSITEQFRLRSVCVCGMGSGLLRKFRQPWFLFAVVEYFLISEKKN